MVLQVIYLFVTTALLPAPFAVRTALALVAVASHAFTEFSFAALEGLSDREPDLFWIKVCSRSILCTSTAFIRIPYLVISPHRLIPPSSD